MPSALALHGGAGLINRKGLTKADERSRRAVLERIRDEAWEMLQQGASALDVTEAAVVSFEESPLFNAGRGAVLTSQGTVELDAALMWGADRSAGGVTCVERVRNPIRAARAVMGSRHVLLAGAPADAFAREAGLEMVENGWFVTNARRVQWQAVRDSGRVELDHGGGEAPGTVGAVALDADGHLAAATSTGGMMNKAVGRVGDTPIVGAGTWAWDQTCAVSCTGHGEAFMRLCGAHKVSTLVEAGLTLEEAAQRVLEDLAAMGSTGGLIAVDRHGTVTLPFNSGGMYRAFRTKGEMGVDIW